MKKKNLLVIIMAVIMCFAICACGSSVSPEKEIIGTWTAKATDTIDVEYTFSEDGNVEYISKYKGASVYKLNGVYEITDDSIAITFEGKTEPVMNPYSIDGEEFSWSIKVEGEPVQLNKVE